MLRRRLLARALFHSPRRHYGTFCKRQTDGYFNNTFWHALFSILLAVIMVLSVRANMYGRTGGYFNDAWHALFSILLAVIMVGSGS